MCNFEDDFHSFVHEFILFLYSSIIKQASYATKDDPDSKQETGYNGQVYNAISRHVFLPSVSEIGKVLNLKNRYQVRAFLNDTHVWTRDNFQGSTSTPEFLEYTYGGLEGYDVSNMFSVRPAFVIDLSNVDYKVAGHTDYK